MCFLYRRNQHRLLIPHRCSCGWCRCHIPQSSCSAAGLTERCPSTCPCRGEELLGNIGPPHTGFARRSGPDRVRAGVCSHRRDGALQTGCSRASGGRGTACTHRRHRGPRSAPAAEGRRSLSAGCCPTDCPGLIPSALSGN